MNFSIARAQRMAVIVLAAFALVGCAVVKINHDGTDSVEHAGGEEEGAKLANRACTKAGAVKAEVIATVKKDESKPEGRSVTSFKCIY